MCEILRPLKFQSFNFIKNTLCSLEKPGLSPSFATLKRVISNPEESLVLKESISISLLTYVSFWNWTTTTTLLLVAKLSPISLEGAAWLAEHLLKSKVQYICIIFCLIQIFFEANSILMLTTVRFYTFNFFFLAIKILDW